jgi:tetratricopeptide (TPR) repeat protein
MTSATSLDKVWAFLDNENWDAAEEELRRIVQVDAQQVTARVELARLLARKEQNSAALELLDAALQIAPDHADALTLKGMLLVVQSELPLAIGLLRQAISVNNKQQLAYVYLGIALRDTDELEESETLLRRAVMLNPQSASALLELAHTLAVRQRPEDAIHTLRQLVKVQPEFMRGYMALAGLYFQHGKIEEAIRVCYQGLETNPNASGIAHLLKNIYWEQHAWDAALQVMHQLCQREPSADNYLELAEVALAAEQFPIAEKACQQAIAQQPDHWLANCMLGELYMQLDRLSEARGYLQTATGRVKDNCRPHNSLGMLLLRQEQPEAALREFQKACQIASSEAVAYYNTGLVLVKLDRLAEATTSLQEAVKYSLPDSDIAIQATEVLALIAAEQ